MTTLTARVRQAPEEVRRYSLDYSGQVNAGETISSVVANAITPLQQPPIGATPVTVTNIVIGPTGLLAVFFVQGGADGVAYEIQFLGTSNLGQVFEDIVEIDCMEKM